MMMMIMVVMMMMMMMMNCREEAARMWQKRENEWERERVARNRLMTEVCNVMTICSWIVCLFVCLGFGRQTKTNQCQTGGC